MELLSANHPEATTNTSEASQQISNQGPPSATTSKPIRSSARVKAQKLKAKDSTQQEQPALRSSTKTSNRKGKGKEPTEERPSRRYELSYL
jgi:hypothetical protein